MDILCHRAINRRLMTSSEILCTDGHVWTCFPTVIYTTVASFAFFLYSLGYHSVGYYILTGKKRSVRACALYPCVCIVIY